MFTCAPIATVLTIAVLADVCDLRRYHASFSSVLVRLLLSSQRETNANVSGFEGQREEQEEAEGVVVVGGGGVVVAVAVAVVVRLLAVQLRAEPLWLIFLPVIFARKLSFDRVAVVR